MSDEARFSWGVPVVALTIGAISFLFARLGERGFRRRYPDTPK